MAKRALLIGINKYQHAKKLRGCVNDVLDVNKVLTAKFGFPAANITQLTDEAATRPKIIAAVKKLIKDTKKDDIIVLYYSGHGSIMRAVRDDEPDGWNETIMPVESSHKKGGKNTDICDDEIFGFIQQLGVKTSYTTLIFDCCHSGSLARNIGDDDGARRAEGDTRDLATLRAAGYQQPSAQPSVTGKGKGGLLPVSDKYVMLAACLDGEIAREKTFKVNGKKTRRGLFTYMLCRQLERATSGSTYLDVFERSAIRTTLFNKTQHPQLEGRFNRKLFGMSEIEPMNYDLIGAPQDKNGQKVVQIGSGTIHGTDVGDVWAIYGRGEKNDDTGTVYGRAEALSVTPRHSEAKILSAAAGEQPDHIFAGYRAVKQTHTYGDERLKIFADVPAANQTDVAALKAKVKALKLEGLIEFVTEQDVADLLLQVVPKRTGVSAGDILPELKTAVDHPLWAVTQNGALVLPLHAINGSTIQAATSPSSTPNKESAIALLANNLKLIAQHRRVLSLQNKAPKKNLAGKFKITLMRKSADGQNWIDAPKDSNGRITFKEGERMAIKVTNTSQEDVYINLLELGVTKRIAQIYPPQNLMGEEMMHDRSFISAGEDGQGHLLNLPRNFPFVQEPGQLPATSGEAHFLLLITEKQVNISNLLQTGARQGGLSALESLLHAATTGKTTRSGGSGQAEVEDWATVVQSYILERDAQAATNSQQRQSLGGMQQTLLTANQQKQPRLSRALTNPNWQLHLPSLADTPRLLIEKDKYVDPKYGTAAVGFSPDGRFMFTHTTGHVAELWSLETGQPLWQQQGYLIETGSTITFSDDGERIHISEPSGTAKTYQRQTFRETSASLNPKRDEGDQEENEKRTPPTLPASHQNWQMMAEFHGRQPLFFLARPDGGAHGIYNSESKKITSLAVADVGQISTAAFTADGRFIAIVDKDKHLRFVACANGRELCRLLRWRPRNATNNTDDNRNRVIPRCAWVWLGADGRFDGPNLEEMAGISFGRAKPADNVIVTAFMEQFYEPQLLGKLLSGDGLPKLPNPAKTTAVLPRISVPTEQVLAYTQLGDYTQESWQQEKGKPTPIELTLNVERPSGEHSGRLRDLRIFREGQMVLYIDSDLAALEKGARRQIGHSTITCTRKTTNGFTFDCKIARPHGRFPDISAYVVQEADDVTLIGQWHDGKADAPPYLKGKSYTTEGEEKDRVVLLGVGVNRYDDPSYNLNYAAKDAKDMLFALRNRINGINSDSATDDTQYEVTAVPLLSTETENNGTKGAFIERLKILAGRAPETAQLKQIGPDDMLICFFAGHGYSGNGEIGREGEFYLLFSDMGENVALSTELLEDRALSSSELSRYMRNIDAGEMVFIIDACHSAASVQGAGFRPGPLGGRGLGQMAYDKKMLILAASQADDVALEDGSLKQGLLTYALVRDGLDQNKADMSGDGYVASTHTHEADDSNEVPSDNEMLNQLSETIKDIDDMDDRVQELLVEGLQPRKTQGDGAIELVEWLTYASHRVPDLYQEVFSGNHRGIKLKKGARGTAARDIADAVYWREVAPQQPILFNFRRKRYPVTLAWNNNDDQ